MTPKTYAAALAFIAGLTIGRDCSAAAAASARLVYLRGPGAEQCPGEPAIRAAVAVRLGYDPFLQSARDSLFVEVRGVSDGLHVELKFIDENSLQRGSRSLAVKGTECADVLDAMALTISLVVDPEALTRAPTSTGERAEEKVRAAAPTPPILDAPGNSAPPRTTVFSGWADVQFDIGAGPRVDLGSQPELAFGSSVSAGGRWHAWSLDLEGRADFPSTGARVAGVAPRTSVAAGSLVPCAHLAFAFGCGVATIGEVTATAVGATSPLTSTALWVAAGGRVGGVLRLAPQVGIAVYVDLLATITRNSLLLNGEAIYRDPPLSGAATIAVRWHFR